ncbi:cilia- and flagella-associated protein 52 isoform X1 [Pezoporus wallicus]|uniref:cilia- and flagella-associated protein 52 isoform X1 n=1 Tax=Pezoporus wallicus TaxID=35540 RepID=UPI00255086B0|nr:cilia- and flagella-associated protein 52 isoform X1 [Pezoporus wallicus]XP_061317949.1 cilia- and flagella-associated protein 52 isoform X1 [Pezoporus flaviventris]
MAEEARALELRAAIGFNGHVPFGLICHPNKQHMLYPLGCTVVIQDLDSKKQVFLHGHTNNVSCVAVSRDGVYVASGEVAFMGFKADIILWHFERKELLARLSLHKGRVEGLAFSPNNLYLISLGGQDDGSVVVWHVDQREAICGSPASAQNSGNATVVVCSSCRDEMFVTAGNNTVRVWELDLPNRKIHPAECRTGHLRRVVTCVKMADDDSYFYIGTSSGDVLKMNTNHKLMTDFGPQKKMFSLGVTTLVLLKTGNSIVGTGEGIVALCKGSDYQVMKKIQVQGGVTSLTCRGQGHQFLIGTNKCQIYRVNYTEFKEELIAACHNEAVHDIVFPFGISDLFATCSGNDIRVWHTPENRELLRIVIPNVTCHAIEIMRDGKSIISAWNDGTIRAFTPETGQPMYVVNHAHSLGVTAIAATNDCKWIISGGGEGQVRVWEIREMTQKLVEVLKEHVSAVSCIKVKKDNRECVTASLDGTCIIWDIARFVRKQMFLANTLFKCVCYHPEEYQVITSGTDRKIGYWEVFDGSVIREVEGSASGSINGMDITSDGAFFVTGGDDHLVKLWDYKEGAVTHVGVGHSGNITRLKICPGKKNIVSVSADGAILLWKYPDLH